MALVFTLGMLENFGRMITTVRPSVWGLGVAGPDGEQVEKHTLCDAFCGKYLEALS